MINYICALFSVFLVTIAQLILKWSMIHQFSVNQTFLILGFINIKTISMLTISIIIYIFSIFLWYVALKHLPLNRIYPIFGLSYILVPICGAFIPEFNEKITLSSSFGIIMICIGLLFIYFPVCKSRRF